MFSTHTSAPRRVLITGSHGLIGAALTEALERHGIAVQRLDLRGDGPDHGDVREPADLAQAIAECGGVVHLAAVSRVIDGEKDPDGCWQTNVEGTRNVLDAAMNLPHRPWVLYASSREVYGQPASLPATEDTPFAPVNIYGRSKAAAEELVRSVDLNTAVVRFSNVYGLTKDHEDRVIPAFARRAVLGAPLRVDGSGHTFDFTHLDDTVHGLLAVIARLQNGVDLPPIHLVTGTPTTLGGLAALAIELAGSASRPREAPPRTFDVSGFYGDPSRAAALLDWRARVSLRDGLARLVADFRAELGEVA